jgi:redox-sensitive bicupin YhaK (pirin superfamily)
VLLPGVVPRNETVGQHGPFVLNAGAGIAAAIGDCQPGTRGATGVAAVY